MMQKTAILSTSGDSCISKRLAETGSRIFTCPSRQGGPLSQLRSGRVVANTGKDVWREACIMPSQLVLNRATRTHLHRHEIMSERAATG